MSESHVIRAISDDHVLLDNSRLRQRRRREIKESLLRKTDIYICLNHEGTFYQFKTSIQFRLQDLIFG